MKIHIFDGGQFKKCHLSEKLLFSNTSGHQTCQKTVPRAARVIKPAELLLHAAQAIADHVRSWALGTAPGEVVSMGVVSDGSYGVAPGIIFSFPVQCADGHYRIVRGLPVSDVLRADLRTTEQELLQERDVAMEVVSQ